MVRVFMMISKRIGIITIMVCSLVACSETAIPNVAKDGHYYMAGDDKCKWMTVIAKNTIQCSDANHNPTEIRYAMTQQQLQMWQWQQQQAQIEHQSFLNALQSLNAQFQSINGRTTNCLTTGSYTRCY